MGVYDNHYKLKNAYVGGCRKISSDTIAYYPLDWDSKDYSWNNRHLTTVTNVDFSSTLSSWQKVAYFNWSNSQLQGLNMMSITTDTLTLSMWLMKTRNHTSHEIFQEISYWTWNNDFRIQTKSTSSSVVGNIWFNWRFGSNNTAVGWYNNTWYANNLWRHIVLVGTTSWMKLYQNGKELPITYDTSNTWWLSLKEFTTITLWWRDWVFWQWYISEVIFEKRWWTLEDILGYFNWKKSLYNIN